MLFAALRFYTGLDFRFLSAQGQSKEVLLRCGAAVLQPCHQPGHWGGARVRLFNPVVTKLLEAVYTLTDNDNAALLPERGSKYPSPLLPCLAEAADRCCTMQDALLPLHPGSIRRD